MLLLFVYPVSTCSTMSLDTFNRDQLFMAPQVNDTILVEIGWEVCNQVGGIYTVLRSKAVEMVQRWGDNYCLLGPLNKDEAQIEFAEEEADDEIGAAVAKLREAGIDVRHGRWLVSGKPRAVLLNLDSLNGSMVKLRKKYGNRLNLTLPKNDELLDDVIAFCEGNRLFLEALAQESSKKRVLAHFHEWMSAASVPLLKSSEWSGRTVFTTHATILGRYLAMHDPDFYANLKSIDVTQAAERFGIEAQHGIETLAAKHADVFSTVSAITGKECTHLLGRRADVLLPNGLNVKRFLVLHEFQTRHTQMKERIHDFTMGYFFPSYSFELDQTLYFFSSGRFEPRNKGMDITLAALKQLNEGLVEAKSRKTVVFLLITRQPTNNLSKGSLHYATMFREFRVIARNVTEEIRKHLIEELAAGRQPDLNSMIPEYWRLRIKRAQHAWKRDWLPPVVTHDMVDDAGDPVLNKIREVELFNNAHDKVKIVYHPDFVNSASPLFGLDYDELIRGCHLGIFPSSYEPWGYTPLETLASGIPAVSSDLAGFGAFAAEMRENHELAGLYLVKRRDRSDEQAIDQLTRIMMNFCEQDRRRRIAQRNRAEAFSQHFDWNRLIHHYDEAHTRAMSD